MPSTSAQQQLLTSNLSNGAQLFVFSIRQWQTAVHQAQCPHARLSPFYTKFKVLDAMPTLDELMTLIHLTAYRPLELNCPCRIDLGNDERILLECLQAVQAGQHAVAENLLDSLLVGRFKTTFRRVAADYLRVFNEAGLRLQNRPVLRVVPKPTPVIH